MRTTRRDRYRADLSPVEQKIAIAIDAYECLRRVLHEENDHEQRMLAARSLRTIGRLLVCDLTYLGRPVERGPYSYRLEEAPGREPELVRMPRTIRGGIAS